MAKRQPPSKFSSERGRLMKLARGDKSQDEIARAVGVKRESISQYESGKILTMDAAMARKFISALGLEAHQLLEDTGVLNESTSIPEVSPEARQVAHSWDTMPASLRMHLKTQMQVWTEFTASSPVLAQLMRTNHDTQREREILYPAIQKFESELRAGYKPKKTEK